LSGPIVFGHAARLIDGKGSDTLIAAFARSEAGRSARLLIAGDGPERPRLERLVDSLKLGSRIQFVGLVDDIWEFWSRCDVAVVPSDAFIESFGMVAVEAMSLGKPVIATRNGGLPEVVGPAGILVEPGDVAGMAFAMDRYAADDELRHVHGSRGRARCERTFAIHRCATDFAELFAHIGQGELSPLPASDGLLEEVHA
jgi:glycosyltransferase involved in cell wall biosynthesis